MTEKIDWKQILTFASAEALSEPGKTTVFTQLEPQSWAKDLPAAKVMQQETQEVALLLNRTALWEPLYELKDPAVAIDLLKKGGVLELEQMVLLRNWLAAMDSWSQVPREEIGGELLRKSLETLFDPFDPIRLLAKILTPDGELSEKASPKIASLHSEIRRLKQEISQKLDELISQYSKRGVLQETVTDVRDGRFVMMVKSSHQGELDGIIFGSSASKQSVFVEPKEITPLNNQLTQKQNDLLGEIWRILKEVSDQLRPLARDIEASVAVLVHWDCVHAKAKLGSRYGGKTIAVSPERKFDLQQAAHPLLWWSLPEAEIVRNDLYFEEPTQTLLLTGPNTGGKTVLLKTLGLACIFARTGYTIPAIGRPIVPFFSNIFVDVGDSQSIEQHLSSFSGHIMKHKMILDRVSKAEHTSGSIVLLDELNSATDPEEGAALARAFLEMLMSNNAVVVATTHDSYLKALAVQNPKILNASVAFNESTRKPSYEILMGVPGRSRALETAERLGMPAEVLQIARGYLTRQHQEFEDTLARLQEDAQKSIEDRKQAILIREEAEKLKTEWKIKTRDTIEDTLGKFRLRLKRMLEESQDKIRDAVRKLDEKVTRKSLDETRKSLNQIFQDTTNQIEGVVNEEAPELAQEIQAKKTETQTAVHFQVGQVVRIPKWKSTGTIMEVKPSDGETKVKVAMGAIQMFLSSSDVVALSEEETKKNAKTAQKSSFKTTMSRPSAPPSRLDLRGTRLEEAIQQLENYLDVAFRSGELHEVTIVHGLGTGALREGARKLLSKLPYVKNYRDGGAGEGGTGATVVELESSL